ncbi:aminotransferase class IV [Rhodococcus sp. P1Y]|uniref:aminotransferase class IV n=1 Tax=Rhodococcus sp. P1Y TaxID=1302308 RepID=UPI0022A857A2|nr:aminotransferase class IV [Rhodococcus sp. P1Y]
MINQDGHLTETTIANLVVELDGVWVTPPLASGCLPESGARRCSGVITFSKGT